MFDSLLSNTRWRTTDSPAINADPQTFADYLRDQAAYYASLDTEYANQVAQILMGSAEMSEFLARSRDLPKTTPVSREHWEREVKRTGLDQFFNTEII